MNRSRRFETTLGSISQKMLLSVVSERHHANAKQILKVPKMWKRGRARVCVQECNGKKKSFEKHKTTEISWRKYAEENTFSDGLVSTVDCASPVSCLVFSYFLFCSRFYSLIELVVWVELLLALLPSHGK